MGELIMWGVLSLLVFWILYQAVRVVPQRSNYVVEFLGKYQKTLQAGLHILIPFVQRVAYIQSLKEETIDVPSQSCITKDNIAVDIDGILYLQCQNAELASYGIDDYRYATSQLAQTTLRSEIGKIELDKTFEERDMINSSVVQAVDMASNAWGVKVLRYEIKDINPPSTVRDALEKQMRAERERRAVVAESEGNRTATINVSEGQRQEMINLSEAEKLKQVNEAEGKATEIELLAKATAAGIRTIAEAINAPGGSDAVNLRVAEQYIDQFGHLAKTTNTLILPSDVGNIAGFVGTVTKAMDQISKKPESGA
ncbi:MAG: stomatin-like protein [Pseudomonadota bacterium]|nr:stomatin-like protein [Pseudomonadota bacterium]